MNVLVNKGETLDRTQVWVAAWIAVATSSTCHNPDIPSNWADRCLKDFDKRFPPADVNTKGTGQ